MSDLTTFERAVVEKILYGEHPLLKELRRQLTSCCVCKREMTGAGFYIYFEVGISSLKSNIDLRIGDVIADITELNYGAGFVLYIKNSKLYMLEGYSYEEPWPNSISKYYLKYISGDNRDLTNLDKMLEGK
jgi:hypothetical protein